MEYWSRNFFFCFESRWSLPASSLFSCSLLVIHLNPSRTSSLILCYLWKLWTNYTLSFLSFNGYQRIVADWSWNMHGIKLATWQRGFWDPWTNQLSYNINSINCSLFIFNLIFHTCHIFWFLYCRSSTSVLICYHF